MRIRLILGIGIIVTGTLALAWLARARTLPLGIHTLHPGDLELEESRELGAQSLVQVFAWSEIEPTQGEFHWEYTDWLVRAAEYYHLRVIARLDRSPTWARSATNALDAPPSQLSDYADFVTQVATRYRGRIAAYIIWNEPNLAREWGNRAPDPAEYAALLRSASARIRASDPHARIVSAGLAPTNEHDANALDDRDFLRAFYAAGAREDFDVLGAHPYGFANPPDDPRGAHAGLDLLRLFDLHDIMAASGDAAKPVWVTEFGYTTGSAETQVSEDQQAQFTPRAYEVARTQMPFVEMFALWNLAQEGPLDQTGYSLVRADGSPKPAYETVRSMEKESPAAWLSASVSAWFENGIAILRPHQAKTITVLARDAVVHLGDSEYSAPWVPLYQTKNPSTKWTGEFYLDANDLSAAPSGQPWTLTMELMQVNDFDSRVLVNDQPVTPADLPTEDFSSIWVTAQFQVPAATLRVGRNTASLLDGKLFPAFQQSGFTWDDFQVRNVVVHGP
jgi:hypothetical protein